LIPYHSGNPSHEHTCLGLEEPPSQFSSQARRHTFKNHNYHGCSPFSSSFNGWTRPPSTSPLSGSHNPPGVPGRLSNNSP